MKIIIEKNYQTLSEKAAAMVIDQLLIKPSSNFGLPTGSTPLGMYGQIIKAYRAGQVSFSSATTFNLDEYHGLKADHPQSYYYFMQKNFFDHIDISPNNIFIPRGDIYGQAVDDFCLWYEEQIKAKGGIDFQVLGIGHNGHIGFNEPGSSVDSRTRLITLSQETIKANSRFFGPGDYQPDLAISMGIATIMEAKKILLLASGESKSAIIKQALNGPVTVNVPASFLQLHKEVTIILDPLAASLI